jgi:hypothetical protein
MFIKNSDLFKCVNDVIEKVEAAETGADKRSFSNVIDPFSAIIDALRKEMPLSKWLVTEKTRQTQKTMQNAIGEMHQAILGKVYGWENLGAGSVIDLRSKSNKVIAEVKNKYNTTKGNHKVRIYDDLKGQLMKEEYHDYVAYYVEVIPKKGQRYDKPFTPSDNQTHTRRPENERIRVIDGHSFYKLVTGREDALRELYEELPGVVAQCLKIDPNYIFSDPMYGELFNRAFRPVDNS